METTTEDEITLEQINKDVENINVEFKKINRHPVINVFRNICKFIFHLINVLNLEKINFMIYLYIK